uniref:Carboxypeptidase n=1 Tax=Strigamia maritima TaxID=126957 RepID=T1J5M9_STRMM
MNFGSRLLLVVCFLCITSLSETEGKKIKAGKETWGYVNIRENASTFWWLYYSTTNGTYTDDPLVMWLQGGPGASSTGYGNFMEIGPLTVDLQPRNKTTWVDSANVLFVDNPVGTGFSYVTNSSAYARNNLQIANDLFLFLSGFLKKLPEFQKVPFFIFSESYGGKMAAGFAKKLQAEIINGSIICNFKGIALGDSWISPVDTVLSWGPYLYSTSLLDGRGLSVVNTAANLTKQAVDSGDFKKATELFQTLEQVVSKETNGVNFYNILKKDETQLGNSTYKFKDQYLNEIYKLHVLPYQGDKLEKLMNGKIREKLRTIPKNVTWSSQSSQVFEALAEDFMVPVTNTVEELLNTTRLSIVVYTGQLDLIVDTIGTSAWLQKLRWLGINQFNDSTRSPIAIPNDNTAGFVKTFKNLAMYWILKAGHMVPADAGETALKMLHMITKGNNKP